MKFEECKIGAHVLTPTTLPTANNFIYHTDKLFAGEVVGTYPIDPQTYGYLRDSKGEVFLFPFAGAVLDPTLHYDQSLATDGYGEDCQCGHPYGRHFDGYEQDPIYPGLPRMVGCKYCECGRWQPVEKNISVSP